MQAIIVTVFALLNLIFYKDKPISPPSFSSNIVREDFKKSLKTLITNPTYILITLTFSLIYGSFIDFAVILGQVMGPYSFGPKETSIASLVCVASGILGSIMLINLLKRSLHYKRLAALCIVFSTGSIVLFWAMLET